jgi:S1-C subfamily serine protease
MLKNPFSCKYPFVASLLVMLLARHALSEQDAIATHSVVETLGLVVAQTPSSGLLVEAVAPASPAFNQGISPGDFLLQIDGVAVRTAAGLRDAVSNKEGDTPIKLTIWRNGKEAILELAVANTSQQRNSEERAWLGVGLDDADGKGAVITQIYPSSPAARAGLRSGDLVVAVGGQEVASLDSAASAIRKLPPNAEVRLLVLRGEDKQEFVVKSRRVRSLGQRLAELIPRSDLTSADRDSLSLIPEHAMRLEMNRRLTEQHERIESLIRQLSLEVEELRQEVRQLSGAASR